MERIPDHLLHAAEDETSGQWVFRARELARILYDMWSSSCKSNSGIECREWNEWCNDQPSESEAFVAAVMAFVEMIKPDKEAPKRREENLPTEFWARRRQQALESVQDECYYCARMTVVWTTVNGTRACESCVSVAKESREDKYG